jgi:hypothetical protein
MKFDLKKPCDNCPFLKDKPFGLRPQRCAGIKHPAEVFLSDMVEPGGKVTMGERFLAKHHLTSLTYEEKA